MSLLRSIASGFRSLFRKEQVSLELDEELAVCPVYYIFWVVYSLSY
jgi:hypothetical protein